MANEGRSLIVKAYDAVVHWRPTPLERPAVDPNFDQMHSLTRSAESIKYNIMVFEYWISPMGGLRECFRKSFSFCILFFLIWLPLTLACTFVVELLMQIEIIFAHFLQIVVCAIFLMFISFAIYALWLHRVGLKTAISPKHDRMGESGASRKRRTNND